MKKISIVFSIAVLLIFSITSSCFASTTYPSITSVISEEYYCYAIYTLSNGEITARVVQSNDKSIIDNVVFIHNNTEQKNYGKFAVVNYNSNTPITVNQYVLRDGVWVLISNTSVGSGGAGFNFEVITDVKIYESSRDILQYDSNGDYEVFFPLTLPEAGLLETTMGMIAQETPEVGTKVAGTMKILLLCGVGCLALLMALPLLLRVFSRYRR